MAFTPGDFTPSAIAASIIKEKNLVSTPRTANLAKDIIAGQAILLHQDPLINPLTPGLSCANAKIYALRSGSLDKGSKVLNCAVHQGPKAGTEALAISREILVNNESFEISEDFCANAEVFTSVLSDLMLKAKIGLELKLSKALVAVLGANIDTPSASWFKTPGSVSNGVFNVTAANFLSSLLADLQWVGRYVGMDSPIILNGRNFYNEKILEMYKSNGCCTNDSILTKNQFFEVFWDSQNIDQVTGASSSFILDKNAILFWNAPVYSNLGMESMLTVGKEPSDRFHFVDTLPRMQYYANGKLNPVYVDVRAEWSCAKDSQGIPRTTWKFELSLSGSIRTNLKNEDDRQGILQVNQVA